jgi:hypothetical protein
MKIFGKKIAYWKEQYQGLFIGIIIFIIILILEPDYSYWKDFIKEFPSIGMCVFGFLITFLSIILQGDTDTIKWMKGSKILFKRFITFNKRIVIISILLSVYSYILGFANFGWIITKLKISECYITFIQQLFISIFCGLLTWLIIDILYFIRIFYLLIKDTK